MKRGWEKGSFTIEASVIIPIYLFFIIMVLELAISFYAESTQREDSMQMEELDMVSAFYRLQMMYEFVEKGTEDGTGDHL